jgi:hypothetical protein
MSTLIGKNPKKLLVSMVLSTFLQQWEDGKEITSLHTKKGSEHSHKSIEKGSQLI